jgi:LysM repeat protein
MKEKTMATVTAYYNENNETLTNDEIKEYLKTGFEAGEAYTQTVIETLKKDYPNLDPSFYNNLSDIGSKGVGVGLTYSSDKTLGENLSFISGDLVQGSLSTLATVKAYQSTLGSKPTALVAFVLGYGMNEGLKAVGIDLGQEAQDLYIEYTMELSMMEAELQFIRLENPELFNDDGTLIGSENTTISTTSGGIKEHYGSFAKTLEENGLDVTTLKDNIENFNSSSSKVKEFEEKFNDTKLDTPPDENNRITVENNPTTNEATVFPTTITYLDQNGTPQNLTYDNNSDLLIYGDTTNPTKITFTNDTTGNFETWQKDSNGNYYKASEVNNDFTINYNSTNGISNASSIVVNSNNLTLNDIANKIGFNADDIKLLNNLSSDTLNANTTIIAPKSVNQYNAPDGSTQLRIVKGADGSIAYLVPDEHNVLRTIIQNPDGTIAKNNFDNYESERLVA